MDIDLFDIVDERLSLKGKDLFRELLRIYPVADIDDYFKNGQWKDQLMKSDLELVTWHRREAGAPDPPDIEDVKFPDDMPAAALAAPKTVLTSGQAKAVPKLAVTGLGMFGKANPLAALTTGAAVTARAAATIGSLPAAELRVLALFVAKWKLDPSRAKAALVKLPAEKRQKVIQTFKTTSPGLESTADLEKFVTEMATASGPTSGALAKAPVVPKVGATALGVAKAGAKAPAQAKAASTPAFTGLKRPLTPAAVGPIDANKRPRLVTSGTTGISNGANVKAAGPAAITPAAGTLAAQMAGGRPGSISQGAARPAGMNGGMTPPRPKAAVAAPRPAGTAGLMGARPLGGLRPGMQGGMRMGMRPTGTFSFAY